MQRICDKHGANGSPSYDEELRWLDQDTYVAVLHQIAAEHSAKNDNNSDDCEH